MSYGEEGHAVGVHPAGRAGWVQLLQLPTLLTSDINRGATVSSECSNLLVSRVYGLKTSWVTFLSSLICIPLGYNLGLGIL